MSLPPFVHRWLRLRRALAPRHKFAVLALIGMLMVATPLAQVLRRHASDIEAVLGAQAAIDPIARAVAVQRALLAHRGPAATVLRGKAGAETERLARQVEVDDRLASLTGALVSGRHSPALLEADHLREDWLALLGRIHSRSLTAAASDAAHSLMVEQTLQVVDLLADAGSVKAVASAAGTDWMRALREPLRQELLLERIEAAAADEAPRVAAGALMTLSTPAGELRAALAQRSDAGVQQLRGNLAGRVATLRIERRVIAGVLLVVALTALGLAIHLWRVIRRLEPEDDHSEPVATDFSAQAAENRQPAERLIERLRQGEAEAGTPPPKA